MTATLVSLRAPDGPVNACPRGDSEGKSVTAESAHSVENYSDPTGILSNGGQSSGAKGGIAQWVCSCLESKLLILHTYSVEKSGATTMK